MKQNKSIIDNYTAAPVVFGESYNMSNCKYVKTQS